jgi:hypothetical protein
VGCVTDFVPNQVRLHPGPALRAQASYPGAFLLEIKKLGHEADPSPLSGVSRECVEFNTSTLPYYIMVFKHQG